MPITKHLIADEFGTRVGKYSERLCVTRRGFGAEIELRKHAPKLDCFEQS